MRASSTRLVELERLAAQIELELRAERARLRGEPPRRAGRPPRGQDAPCGTEQRYQWEARQHRRDPARFPAPDETCKAAHALHERRRTRAARATSTARRTLGVAS